MPDAVVIGAGPNGLVAANHLADRGWSVVVLEAAAEPGGAVRSGELTIPGFTHDLFSAFYPLALASPAMRDLGLEAFGLRWKHAPLVLAHPFPDGRCASLSTDVEVTSRSVARFAHGDGDAWRRMVQRWDLIADPITRGVLGPFPPARSMALIAARLRWAGTLGLLRHALLPVRRMAEEMFDGEGAALLLGGSSLHADLCPEAAGSGFFGWFLCCLGQRFGFPVPEGGAAALTGALVARLESVGGRLECGSRVREVVVCNGRAVGAATADGRFFRAERAVLADVAAPDLYRCLVGAEHLPPAFRRDLENFQWDTSTVKVDWALRHPVPWAAPESAEAGTVHIADDFDNLTEFSAHLAMGLLPAKPFLIFGQQSRTDPTRSPPGTETAWAYTHVPRVIRGDARGEIGVSSGEPSAWLPALVERIEDRIERLAPGFRDSILGRHCFGPGELHAENANLDLGSIGGGTAQLHQQLFLRPVPGGGRPETPIASLFLASSSAHPGGGVHGAAGANAARAALRSLPRVRSFALGRGPKPWARSPGRSPG